MLIPLRFIHTSQAGRYGLKLQIHLRYISTGGFTALIGNSSFYVRHLCQVVFLNGNVSTPKTVFGNPAGQRAPKFAFATISVSNHVSNEATWLRAVGIADV